MNVGIVWPTPGDQPEPLPEDRLMLLRDNTLATHLRINLHHRKPTVDQMVATARQVGFEVLPILDFDYDNPNLDEYGRFCQDVVERFRFPGVELGNEPHILHKMPPAEYAAVFTRGAEAIRESGGPVQIHIAGEITIPIGKKIKYFGEVRKRVPDELYDVVAIHPYRNPKPPTHAPFNTRQRELEYYQSQVPHGKGIAVTEVGWDLRDGVTEEKQAQYLAEELRIWDELGVDAVYVYQHIDPPTRLGFGIFTATWQPRPAAGAIAEFQRARGISFTLPGA